MVIRYNTYIIIKIRIYMKSKFIYILNNYIYHGYILELVT